jgi:hypothetical protein
MQPQQPPYPPVPDQPVTAPPAPGYPQPLQPYTDFSHHADVKPNYDFILADSQKPKRQLLNGGSRIKKILVLLVGLIILIILFSFVKGLLKAGKPFNEASLISVAQDQAEIQHLITVNSDQTDSANLSTSDQNFLLTGALSLQTEQAQLTKYFSSNGVTVPPALLGGKISSSIDTEILNSKAANTYNQTFTSAMQAELTTYQHDLITAYKLTTGPKGKALLSADYTAAGLLQKSIASSNS